MSRGKKSKRKTGERRKRQEAVMLAAALSSVDNDGSSVVPTNQSRAFDQLTSTTANDTLRSENVEIDETSASNSGHNLTQTGGAQEICAVDDPRRSGSLTILFRNDELQTLRSVLQKTDLSRTPLLLGAIILGRSDVVRRLLRDGYPINSRSEGDKTTALMWAVRNKDLEMINLLVRHGADITLLDENDDNVALIAVQSASWEQNDFLDFWSSIDRKIDLGHANTSGNTILHYARERRWDVLAKLIGTDLAGEEPDIEPAGNGTCVCCFAKPPRGGVAHRVREKTPKPFPPEEMESTLSHLTVLFDEIVNRYRETWSRDRSLGYPGFRGGQGDSAATIDDLMSLRREEIARLNTILPKLEESYLQKLRDCWSSLVSRMRLIAGRDRERFGEYVTSIQIQLLTHEVCPRTDSFERDVTDRAGSAEIDEISSRRHNDSCA